MKVQFYDEPNWGPASREEVRFRGLGLYLYEDRKRVAVGFDITPFQERPNIEVRLVDDEGGEAASLHVIEAMQPKFSLTMHIRDQSIRDTYDVNAVLYYTSHESGDRLIVDSLTKKLDTTQIGEQ